MQLKIKKILKSDIHMLRNKKREMQRDDHISVIKLKLNKRAKK